MRKVHKDIKNVPAVLLSVTCNNLVVDALNLQGKHEFETKIYGHDEVRKALFEIYKGKCAFCETDTSAGATMQVEHYRPKAKVTGVNYHPGYYWLGYEWSNLLLACSSCNNRKRNRFPVASSRVITAPLTTNGTLDRDRCQVISVELLAENPLLVNPEVESDPMKHFRFQADGQIEHSTTSGQISIETCNLNRASLIVKRRKIVYDRVFNKMLKHFDRFNRGLINEHRLHILLVEAIEDLIEYLIDDNNQYLEFAKTCWKEFDNFFILRFQPAEKERLQAAYNEIKQLFNSI
jgi:uncharacterized protein (TIGR02646 family)